MHGHTLQLCKREQCHIGIYLDLIFKNWLSRSSITYFNFIIRVSEIRTIFEKRIPEAFQLLLVAPIALLVTGFVSFIAIGPVTFAIANALTDGLVALFDRFAALGGLVYGGLYAVLVVTGMHHTFLAVDLQLIGSTGGTFLWPMLALSNIAQGSAALAMMFATKDEKLKGLSFTSAISAYLGITEPAMFGVNLRFRYPFISALIGSAIAGILLRLIKCKLLLSVLADYLDFYRFSLINGHHFHRHGYRPYRSIYVDIHFGKTKGGK